jgi:hypothetical protein
MMVIGRRIEWDGAGWRQGGLNPAASRAARTGDPQAGTPPRRERRGFKKMVAAVNGGVSIAISVPSLRPRRLRACVVSIAPATKPKCGNDAKVRLGAKLVAGLGEGVRGAQQVVLGMGGRDLGADACLAVRDDGIGEGDHVDALL